MNLAYRPTIPGSSSLVCDECGKAITKIERIHKGQRFCATCYVRMFKRRVCPKCGNFARLPKNDPDAICLACQRDKPCVRCGKTGFQAGLITEYGPVCGACAHYFKEPENCEACGKPSTLLARVTRLGHGLRVCPACSRVDHGTCSACRKHRLLMDKEGKRLCPACLEQGDIPCPRCGVLMPAGLGKRCDACYWKGVLAKRIALNLAVFSKPGMANHFKVFCTWLEQEVGVHKAALTINRYVPFFMAVDQQWGEIPGYRELLGHFGTAGLRKVLLPVRWMESAGLIVVDVEAKQDESERRRIEVLLAKLKAGSPERKMLEGYHGSLKADLAGREITLRSVRLALTPAVGMLELAIEKEISPGQPLLKAFLDRVPGQRAAVSGFVGYLRNTLGIPVVLPKLDKKKAEQRRKKQLEAEMLALMRVADDSEEFRRKWLSVALAYFHGLPREVGLNLKPEDIKTSSSEEIFVTVAKTSHLVPILVGWFADSVALGGRQR